MNSFNIINNDFCLNGKPFQILSGSIHYFRVHPDYWKDRIIKLKMMGLNTLETYVAWNLHEPKPGEFDFDGWLDLVNFIEIAGESGLKVIVRPGPYICSEWEFGGLPAWLLKDPKMSVRCNYKPYFDAVTRFFSSLFSKLAPLQISNGGPIIAMQIDNEYGAYGNDKIYLESLEKLYKENSIDVLLFTSDGANDAMMQYGTLPHILKTINFGSKTKEHLKLLRKHQPEGPLMTMEFWNGWFDHWGEKHHTRKPEEVAEELNFHLETGASVNFYMFHGGSNFGFMNGANLLDNYQPVITSYDSDAPLDETGNITPKFKAFRKVIAKYSNLPQISFPEPTQTLSVKPFELNKSANLLSSLNDITVPVSQCVPESMEYFDQSYGFILYETQIAGPIKESPLIIKELHDRAHIFVDDKLIGILEREFPEKTLSLIIPPEGIVLKILVENMGRVNYGGSLIDRKGITECVILGQQILYNWKIYSLPFDDLSCLDFGSSTSSDVPAFFRGEFQLNDPQDSFFFPHGWSKGVCWINNFNIGRYWKRGPQQTLYVPKPIFKKGLNEIIILELDKMNPNRLVGFCDKPKLNNPQ